ncbi:MAG: HNH endonuclease signature motif containing protein [Candidatus Acidiferrales bacterium]
MCIFCGSERNVEVHHVDGEESNNEPGNLAWACRACNVVIGRVMQRHGLGRRSRQFNPHDSQGARTLGQWLTAVLSMKGESSAMDVPAAVEMIRATAADRRSHFAKQIWKLRREHGTDRQG